MINLLALILWFISLAGLKAIPLPGTCEPVPGPHIMVSGEVSPRTWCIDSFGTMREQGDSR